MVAAGAGKRLKSKIPKALVAVKGVPMIIRALRVLSAHRSIRRIIVVGRREDIPKIKSLIARYNISRVKRVVCGGPRRRDSVWQGLENLDENTEFVLIHDAARPFVSSAVISRVIKAAKRWGAAVAAVATKDTLKAAQRRGRQLFVDYTLPRELIWRVQTPQVFRRGLIIRGHKAVKNKDVTDDAYLVERLGHKVALVLGDYVNIKITTPEDI